MNIIYGRIPVMTSAQCVVKTTNGCTHHPVTTTLTDRRGKQFPVKNHCGFCYNTVYNSAPLSLFDEREEWMRMHPRSIRVQFSTETGNEVTRILNAALAVNTRNAASGMSGEEFTRGHFRRRNNIKAGEIVVNIISRIIKISYDPFNGNLRFRVSLFRT